MFNVYYDMIPKRKSFHIFPGGKFISGIELDIIRKQFAKLIPLYEDIKVEYKIVPRRETSCKTGEYCILIYSEVKDNYVQNIGYLGQQLDLFLTAMDIGVCWNGMGKTDEKTYNGLDFAIMFTIEKSEGSKFRKSLSEAKRKSADEIKSGSGFDSIAEIARYAPSACNLQPWHMECKGNTIEVWRDSTHHGIIPKNKVAFFQGMDVGIFMLYVELCLQHEGYKYERKLFTDNRTDTKQKCAEYVIE